ncbi:MAG: hypothetical protein LBI15_02430 [Dysgonamonadaceae bacterium]|jgi:hypothetical protein|nr:hypothetical protein [Dysgonamonadaceae bacterium]
MTNKIGHTQYLKEISRNTIWHFCSFRFTLKAIEPTSTNQGRLYGCKIYINMRSREVLLSAINASLAYGYED